MANVNAPRGFTPIKSLSGSGVVTVNSYKVASSASRIGKGDLVSLQSSGYIQRETSATAVGPWIGVSLADTGTISAEISAHPVCDDLNAIYEAQGSTAALATTDIGTCVAVDASSGVDSNYGTSKAVLTSTAATASNGVRILRFVNAPDNAVGASARLEVMLNAAQIAPNTAAI